MLTDADQANELGLPLVRGPFLTLQVAKEALDATRSGPPPVSDLAERISRVPPRAPGSSAIAPGRREARRSGAEAGPPRSTPPPPPPPVVVREYRTADGDALRALWSAAGLNSLGDDEASLRVFAQRNPGLFLVAAQGAQVVGSVMGAWDGRRGWLYHVAVAESQRRAGLATRLVVDVEARLRALGCPKVNVIVRQGNDGGAAFWSSLGYEVHGAQQLGHQLSEKGSDGQ